jgi:hypothetical protein
MWRKVRWVLLIVGVVCAANMVFSIIYLIVHCRAKAIRPTVTELIDRFRVQLPEGSVLVASYGEQYGFHQEGRILVRLEVPRESVDKFIRSIPDSPFKRTSSEDRMGIDNGLWQKSFVMNPREPWWDPDSMKDFTSVDWEHMPTGGMLISRGEGDLATVYLLIFIT